MDARRLIVPAIHCHPTQRLRIAAVIILLLPATSWPCIAGAAAPFAAHELLRGFTAFPDPSSSSFQSLITDPTGNYSLGFLPLQQPASLTLAVVHLLSSETLWRADITSSGRWYQVKKLLFNGSLVLADRRESVLWSTDTDGDRVWLCNTSNLQIQKIHGSSREILWQSFDFPCDTLMENQNFSSSMSLISANGLYMMRLGSNFMGLFVKFERGSNSGQIYWKRTALEAKASIIPGQGPIHAILSSDGYLGMYQNGSIPVDVQSFSSFQQLVSGRRRVRMESDGNLRGYYWTGSTWMLDYQAISDPCELPGSCGSYGLCWQGKGCSCIDGRWDYNSGGCISPKVDNSGDLCGPAGENKYWVLRRKGVELGYKELKGYEKMGSVEECEGACEGNCKCWGALYSNTSGFCYTLDYPIQTMVGEVDETRMGYFKVREGAGKKGMEVYLRVGIGLLCGTLVLIGGAIGLGCWKMRMGRRRASEHLEEDGVGAVGPYKNLRAASFKSIELCER